jgi:hypothetical protein
MCHALPDLTIVLRETEARVAAHRAAADAAGEGAAAPRGGRLAALFARLTRLPALATDARQDRETTA